MSQPYSRPDALLCIATLGKTIFTAGYYLNPQSTYSTPRIYKNNQIFYSPPYGGQGAVLQSLVVQSPDEDIYLGGYEINAEGVHVATLWQNYAKYMLTEGLYESEIRAIPADGNTVYAAGYEMNSTGNYTAVV